MTIETKASAMALGGTDPVPPSQEEYTFMSMTAEQREELIERLRWADAKAKHDAQEAELQRKIDEQTATAVASNPQLNGWNTPRRAVISNGEYREEEINRTIPGSTALGYVGVDPTSIPVVWGGIQLSGEQAKAMLADGTISQAEYSAAVTEAMQPYRPGYKHSFR